MFWLFPGALKFPQNIAVIKATTIYFLKTLGVRTSGSPRGTIPLLLVESARVTHLSAFSWRRSQTGRSKMVSLHIWFFLFLHLASLSWASSLQEGLRAVELCSSFSLLCSKTITSYYFSWYWGSLIWLSSNIRLEGSYPKV